MRRIDASNRRAASRARGLTVLALAAALGGCAGGGWVKDHPEVAERARTEPGAFVEPAFAQYDGLESLAGSYQMRVSKGIGRRTYDLAVSVRRPDLVDMNVLDATGAIQAFLRASSEQVGLYVAEDRVLYAGPATREAFERALGFDLSAADAVAVLLGYGVERQGLPRAVPTWDADARRIRVDYGPSVSLWLHPVTMLVDRVEHRRGDARVRVDLLEWLHMPNPAREESDPEIPPGTTDVAIPSRLEIQVTPDGYGIRLAASARPSLNPEFPPGFFDLQVPAGTQQLPLEELARQGGLFRRAGGEEDEGR